MAKSIVVPKRRLHLVYSRVAEIIGPVRSGTPPIYRLTPYVYGGGHGPGFEPTKGIPLYNPKGLIGYDCSGLVSAGSHAGGVLGVEKPAPWPLDTEELVDWGDAGEGEHITVWVRNDPGVQQHCFFDFHGMPEWPVTQRYAQAPHTGEWVEWFTAPSFAGFHPRHFPGT